MALQVWLPLLGDLNNNGVNNATITNNGATVDNNGKLGKCYKTNGSSSYITGTYTATENMSFCIWAKFNSNPVGHLIDGRVNDVGYQPMYIASNVLQTGGSTGGFPNITYSFSTDVWYHLCVVYTSTNVSLYVNGSLVSTTTGGKGYAYGEKSFSLCCRHSHDRYFVNANIQDFRIYDNALSPKEVELLARGLVLHYPMTGGGRGGDNLVIDSQNLYTGSSVSTKYIGCRGGTRQLRDDGFYESKCTGAWQGLSTWSNAQNFAVGDIITYSFYIYVSGSAHAISFYPMMYNSAGTRDTTTKLPISVDGSSFESGNSRGIGTISSTTPEFHYVTFEWNSAVKSIIDNGGRIELSIQANNGSWTDSYVCFFKPKLEKGSKPTPWMPNSADTAYTTMGYNDNTEYDVSGYNNHGTRVGSITNSSETPRYSTSTHFNASSAYISTTGLTTTGFGNSYSFAWWAKMDNRSYMHWGFQDGIRLNGMYYGNLWNTGDGTNNPLYKPGTTTQVDLPTYGVWHHWVMTGDGTTCKVYQDGVLWAQAKTYKSISGTIIIINGWNTATDYSSSNYSISDFRIYATALTATQIAELYNTSASIANNGTLLAYEFTEN